MIRRGREVAMRLTQHASFQVRVMLFAAFACATSAAIAHAASEAAGTAAASFLSVGSGASVLSMGGATLASGSDLASAAWNPASLARVDALQFALTHAPMPGGATQDWLAAGGRVGGEWRWSTQALFHREGGIEGRDASNNPTGDLTASDVGVGAHLARRIGGVLDVGVGAEWVHESLAGTPGSGVAFSGGVRGEAGPLGFALAARHLGGGMSYGATRYDLPGVIAAGVSYEDPEHGLRVAADLESPTHYYRSLRLGGEWLWRGQFALRAGYRSELGNSDAARLSGPTFGLGTGAGSVWMDYAFMPGGEEGAGEHRLGITFRPGGLARGHGSEGGMHMTGTAPANPQPRTSTSVPATTRTTAPAASEKRTMPAAAIPAAASSVKPDAEPTPVPPVVKSPSAEAAASAVVPATPKPAPVPEQKPAPAESAPAPAATPPVAPPKTAPVAEPAGKPAPAAAPAAAPSRPSSVIVAEGETLASIARRWGTSVPALMMANNLVNEKVSPGKKLKLPLPVKR